MARCRPNTSTISSANASLLTLLALSSTGTPSSKRIDEEGILAGDPHRQVAGLVHDPLAGRDPQPEHDRLFELVDRAVAVGSTLAPYVPPSYQPSADSQQAESCSPVA